MIPKYQKKKWITRPSKHVLWQYNLFPDMECSTREQFTERVEYDSHHDRNIHRHTRTYSYQSMYITSQVLFSNMKMKQQNPSSPINRRTRTRDNLSLHDTGNL